MLFSLLRKTINGFFDASLWRIVTLSSVISFLFLVAIIIVCWSLLNQFQFVHDHWLEAILDIAGKMTILLVIPLLFPFLLPIIASFFHEHLVNRVTEKQYHTPLPMVPQPYWRSFLRELRFFFWASFLNILCLPFYLIPVVNFVIYYALNGYLLGRTYFDLVALLYLKESEATIVRKKSLSVIYFSGIIITFMSNVPLVNILVPSFAIIFMTHIFHEVYPTHPKEPQENVCL